MKVTVIGGGPGGLYFALLAKKAWPRWEIKVHERNRPDDTFGFGVVFSDQTLDTFKAYDLVTYERIRRRFAYWGDVDVVYKGRVMRSGGNGFCGCSRVALLNILQDRGRELGVQMRFQREVEGLEEFAGSDLIVVADGINSQDPREVQGSFPAERGPAAQQVHLARLDPAARRLQVFLPRDARGSAARALLPVRAGPLHLGDRDGRGHLAQFRLRPAVRDRHAAGARARVRRGARRPSADRQPLAVAQLPEHHQQDLGEGQRGARRRRQGDRAFLHRFGNQARDGGRDRPVRGVQEAPGSEQGLERSTTPRGARRSRRPSTRPTCRSPGSST